MSSTSTIRDGAQRQKTPTVRPIMGGAREVALQSALGLDVSASGTRVEALNQLLVDTMTLRDLYKKHHWQAAGPVFYMIHLLFDKHYAEQAELIDLIAERIQTLGGDAIAMAADVAEATKIPRAPKAREETAAQIARLLRAHELILWEARTMAKDTQNEGDAVTNDIIVSDVIRTNELQVWFLAQHVQ
ncbi:MAG: DNA starvation/stationary phase protection protein [Planctomycetes bacterium]|nr:DNA starvation/stationary phase protection protein [Planctomycetota bacterium]